MQIYSLVKIPEKVTEDRYKENGVAEKEIEVRCIEEYFWVANGTLVKYTGNQVDIRIPEDVKAIGNWIFVDCLNVKCVFIPHSVKRMGQYAFTNCKALSRILYEGTEEEWQRVTGGRRRSIGEHVEILCKDKHNMSYADKDLFEIKDGVLARCKNVGDGSAIIPPSVSQIGDWAFDGRRGLVSIKIPPSVTQIGTSAFRECSGLTSIEIPQSVTKIGAWGFCECSSLESIEISPSVDQISYSAFEGCSSLLGIKIPPSVSQIGDSAFRRCSSLISIEIPPSVKQIGDSAFEGCSSLVSIEIPLSVTQIGYSAFGGCNNLTDIFYEGSKSEWKKLGANIPKKINVHYDYRK